jgi:hypothetical protein
MTQPVTYQNGYTRILLNEGDNVITFDPPLTNASFEVLKQCTDDAGDVSVLITEKTRLGFKAVAASPCTMLYKILKF